MIIYWALLAVFAFAALIEQPDRRTSNLSLWVGGVVIALLIGMRFEVGADWEPYIGIFKYSAHFSLARTITQSDPGYMLLNWLVQKLGGEFWLVNVFCGFVFSFGLVSFARVQERPWLTILVAIPYLIIVVAMGYTRQSVAIGIILIGLASYFKRQSIVKLSIYFLLASLFHKTALVALPLIFLGSGRMKFFSAFMTSAVTYALYTVFLANSMGLLVKNYLDYAYSSQGAAVRVAMNIVPAAVFFANTRNLGLTDVETSVWRNFSVAGLVLLLLLLTLSSSTVVDRLALYVIPLQLAVLPRAWKGVISDRLGVASVVLYCCLVQFSWLNFAVHARFWVPYRFWPFE